jgi:hypothetical protein
MALQTFWQRCIRDKQGRTALLQLPNAPLITGVIAMLLQKILPYGQLNFIAELVAYGALFTWAWLEIFQGSSYLRRVLGAVIMCGLIISRI